MAVGAVALLVLMLLIAISVPVGVALGVVGVVGMFVETGTISASVAVLGSTMFSEASQPAYVVIPMFILMGALAYNTGISGELFGLAYRTLGRLNGGVAIAVCWASAAFGAVTGSSTATTVAMGRLALPEMDKYGYHRRLSLGVIASAGTFAAMIPPSIMLVVYAIFTEQSVGRMLIAGVVPGLLTAALYSVSILIRSSRDPSLGPKGPSFTAREVGQSAILALPFIGIVAAIVLGILMGFWSPTEAASVGVVFVALVGFMRRRLSGRETLSAVRETVIVTGRVFILVIGSLALGRFLTVTGFTQDITQAVIGLGLPPLLLFAVLCFFYIILGTFLEGISMLAITVPFVMPVVVEQGWDLVWFGVIFVKLVEIAAVTPPVGLNLYALKSVVPRTSIGAIARSSVHFWLLDVVILIVMFALPDLVLWLPGLVID